MLFNYLKISARHLVKNKSFTLINISGLTLGFLCFILLALYIQDELSFDMFHRDASKMYRLIQHRQEDDGTIHSIGEVAVLIGKEAKTQYEEVEDFCRLTAFGRVTMGNEPISRVHERVISTDNNFFTFFDFPLVEGNPKTVLVNPDAIVLSERMAKKYFGNESPVGKQLWSGFTRNQQPVYFTVTGVMKDFPQNSHLQIDAIFSEATWASIYRDYNEYITTDWTENEYTTYLKLKPGTDASLLATKIDNLVKTHYPVDEPFKSKFSLQSLHDIHLHSENITGQPNEFNASSTKPFYMYMFTVVGLLLILIACLNYMNLSTAAAFKRIREIGTRKTLGAQRSQLIFQFITDSLILSAGSLVLALIMVELALPFVNSFTGKNMQLYSLPITWMSGLTAITLVAGLLSALYPALISARISSVQALKKEIKIANQAVPVRKVLLAAQFCISILMITSTLVIYRQLTFMREKDLGFEKENLLVLDINSRLQRRNFETVKAEFGKVSEVVSITASTRVPGEWKSFPVATVNPPDGSASREMIFVGVDKDFLSTYNIKLLEGRTIEDPKADSLKIVLTQLAVQQLGLKNPIGQIVELPSVRYAATTERFDRPFQVEVIGVVEDFHFESLHKEMMPVIFGAPNTAIQQIDYYTLKVNTRNWDNTIKKLQVINAQLDPNTPLEYTFLDNRFEELYQADAKRGQIFLVFSFVIVLIACMGLFALVSYSVESRTKEIGVRKVLGASVQSIISLISKEFLGLVALAGVIACPVAWYLATQWLSDFAYRINLGFGIFFMAMIAALVIAFVTICLRTIRAAVANPVESLRIE